MRPIELSELAVGGTNVPVFDVDRSLAMPLPDCSVEHAYRLTAELRPEIGLEALVVNRGSRVLVVSFHGATNRATTELPRFERLRTLSGLNVSSLYFSDPTLLLDPKIWLAWYTGWRDELGDVNVHSIVADWVVKIAKSIGATNILLTGSSGGGFAALQVGSKIPGSTVLAMNAQTEIGNYLVEGHSYSQQKDYVRVVWPNIWRSFSSPNDIVGSGWVSECDDRVSALRTYSTPRDCRVYLLQNIEEYHYADHFLPFLDAAWSGGNYRNIVPWTNRQGVAHVVPPLDVFVDLVRSVVRSEFGVSV